MEAEKPQGANHTAPLPDWRKRPIILVGLMGSGKTSVGKRLAARLNRTFTDADAAIEHAAGQTVAEIFARFGEAHFRDGERRVIARLLEEEPGVIATGGGAFCDPDTRRLALEKGLVVWLDASIPTLVARVSGRRHRPLLVGKDPAAVLSELAAVRNPFYAQAHLRIESRNVPHEETVEQLLARLKEQSA